MTRIHRTLYLLAALLLASSMTAIAQENKNVTWKLLTSSIKGAPGQIVDVKVQAKIAAGSHVYSTKKYPADVSGPQSTEITVGEKDVLALGGRIKAPKPIVKRDENFEMDTEYWEGTVMMSVPVKIVKNAAEGNAKGWVKIYFMSCDDKSCQPPTEKKFTFDVQVKPDTAKSESVKIDTTAKKQTAAVDTVAKPAAVDSTQTMKRDSAMTAGTTPSDTAHRTAVSSSTTNNSSTGGDDVSKARKKGLGAFLLVCALGGLWALLTPCVFPMISITVSFFTKREQTTRIRSIRDAGLYALGIILTFTVIGFITAVIFGPSAIGLFASNPIVNLTIAVVFIIFALNLFGMFEIRIPISLINRLNRSANEQGSSVGGLMLMGVVFSITSFTCIGAVVSSLLFTASKGDWSWPLLGMATFATVFAAPFFLLALFPALMKSLPKSGGWLNSVKVIMGFVEVAAAIKFFSNADLVWQWGVLTRELFLAGWIAVAVVTTVYLLGRFQLPHDTPVEKVGPVRVLFAVTSLAFAFWLLTGLFGARLGELDAFIAPQEYPGKGNTSLFATLHNSSEAKGVNKSEGDLTWIQDDYTKALATARQSGKPIFIDFTGYTCTNCRWMEQNMFTRQEVADLMKRYVLVRLYTDGRDTINQKNRQMQVERFQTVSLPYYAVLTSQDSVIAWFPNMTREANEFVEFLRKGVSERKMAMR